MRFALHGYRTHTQIHKHTHTQAQIHRHTDKHTYTNTQTHTHKATTHKHASCIMHQLLSVTVDESLQTSAALKLQCYATLTRSAAPLHTEPPAGPLALRRALSNHSGPDRTFLDQLKESFLLESGTCVVFPNHQCVCGSGPSVLVHVVGLSGTPVTSSLFVGCFSGWMQTFCWIQTIRGLPAW